jgi:hypothetical protein
MLATHLGHGGFNLYFSFRIYSCVYMQWFPIVATSGFYAHHKPLNATFLNKEITTFQGWDIWLVKIGKLQTLISNHSMELVATLLQISKAIGQIALVLGRKMLITH